MEIKGFRNHEEMANGPLKDRWDKGRYVVLNYGGYAFKSTKNRKMQAGMEILLSQWEKQQDVTEQTKVTPSESESTVKTQTKAQLRCPSNRKIKEGN